MFYQSITAALLSLLLVFKIFTTPPVATAPQINCNHFMQDTSGIIAEGATLQLISNQFKFTEGPTADKWGNVYFTDQPNNRIWKWQIDGQLTTFIENSGRSNGLYIDKKGKLYACADEKNQLWVIDESKNISVLVKDFNGQQLNGPNDVWVRPSGGLYFTDPYYHRPYWKEHTQQIKEQRVYYLPKGSGKLVIADESLKQPNGIVGTPDGKFLYVADIGDNKTYKYTIKKDGSLTNRQLFAAQGSDGMTIDNKGNIYLTGNGVTVYNSKGTKIAQIPVPANWTANVCFGGKNKDLLFITASESVFTLRTKVKGVQ